MTTQVDLKHQVHEIIEPLRGHEIVLIPALQAVQEKLGYVPPEAMGEIGALAGVSPNTVYGVTTFYAQFRTAPVGRRRVAVCRGTACHVRGSERILEAIERALRLGVGETSKDKEFSLETVACIGACALAPTLRINEETHGKLTSKSVEELFPRRARQEEASKE